MFLLFLSVTAELNDNGRERKHDLLPTFHIFAMLLDTVQAKTSSEEIAIDLIPVG